jgi:outer membrane protein OmpA-like peptidoglycan-associated protein
MTILLIIFVMLIASYGAKKYKTVEEVQSLQNKIYLALMKEFEHDLESWSAEINENDATVSFTGYNLVQFKQGSDYIESDFKEIISDFFPRYVKVIKRYNNDVRRVRIEGHTSSEWSIQDSDDQKYLKNLNLSQRRAFNVLELCLLTLRYGHKEWIKSKIGSEGLSSSKLVINNDGSEDKKRSRRTVFKIEINHGNYLLKEKSNHYLTSVSISR